MAEGVLGLSTDNQLLEDAGNECFISLISRYFFQDVIYNGEGNIVECKIHDLRHDLAESVAGTGCTQSESDASNIDERNRNISFVLDLGSSLKFPTALCRAKNLRTFHLLGRFERTINTSDFNKI